MIPDIMRLTAVAGMTSRATASPVTMSSRSIIRSEDVDDSVTMTDSLRGS